jgi:hypothetical protein
MGRSAAIKITDGLPGPSFDRKIRDVRFQVRDNQFIVIFESGKEYNFSRSALEVNEGREVVSVRVDR